MVWPNTLAVIVCVLTGLPVPAQPSRYVVDFDSFQAGTIDTGQIVLKDAAGSGIDLTISGPALTVIDLFEFAGHENVRGSALITNLWPQTDGITVEFSRPVTQAAITAGDFGSDDDGPLKLTAYSCQGQQVGEATAPWEDWQMPPFAPLTIEADEICRVHYTSGGAYAGSAFMDNLSFTVGDPLSVP